MIDISYSRLVRLLDKSTDRFEEISMQAWLVVGNFNRLRILLRKISGVKKNEPWFQLFSRKIRVAEEIRHIVEHYASELNGLIDKTKPLLGHTSWLVYEEKKKVLSRLILPGTIRKFKGLGIVNPAGKRFRAKIDHVTYYLGANELDISDLIYDLQNFTKSLEEYIENKYFSG